MHHNISVTGSAQIQWMQFTLCDSRSHGKFVVAPVPDLTKNYITGSIPVLLYDLKMLKEIVLDKNNLSGQLRPAIAQLQHLVNLIIS
jgi:hypothetical protein